jgi:hypothetical protein
MNYEIWVPSLAFPESNLIGKIRVTNNKFKYTYNIWRESSDQYAIYARNLDVSIIDYLISNNICIKGTHSDHDGIFIKLQISPHVILELI